ncbi:MAG: hypothetical protein UX58_C0002G0108 [Candidatus Wolfebacteria bacterium GW2011_GWB2_46_69]|nr:MAG: hypothetical protein UX58_C0002G0108 [Candidatus Wolfebacteria bacterium GW2011_GWB2_46_69]KKU66191.1 MAG: hypothetical protein UX90_C0001G0250 [Candidatus Wolfebacteria bacterium GW2011_GWD2_47_17]
MFHVASGMKNKGPDDNAHTKNKICCAMKAKKILESHSHLRACKNGVKIGEENLPAFQCEL